MLIEALFYLLGCVVLAWIFAAFGAYVAKEKGRSPNEGIVFGLLLGPFGVIAVACLPTREPGERPASATLEDRMGRTMSKLLRDDVAPDAGSGRPGSSPGTSPPPGLR
jgi:hypothetical protein